jgi:stage II sporulation protein D
MLRVLRVLTVLSVLKVPRVPVLRGLGVLGLAGGALMVSACVAGPVRIGMPGAPAAPATRAITVRVQVKEGTSLVVREVPIEEYVATTAMSEVHPDVADQAIAERTFEVQAVIARTYAMANRGRHAKDGFDLCSTTHCQLYEPARAKTSRWASVAADAARRTAGQMIWFGDAPAQAVFHADCGGHTSNAAAVWGGVAFPYLCGERDGGPAGHAHSEWTFETRAPALRAALNADPRTAVGARLDRVEVAGRDGSGRAEQIVLRGTRTFVVRGEVFRDAVTRALGAKSLRSTLFTVKRTREGFVFSGKGFGHGVGLCQAGALARLKAGASPADVLSYYFPGTSLHR